MSSTSPSKINNYSDDISESSSSDRLIQTASSPGAHSEVNAMEPTMVENETDTSKELLVDHQDQQQPPPSSQDTPPGSLDLESGNNRKPTHNSLKNWVRLASFEKSDLSPSAKSVSSNNSTTASASFDPPHHQLKTAKSHDDTNSVISDGSSLDSPSKKSLLWKKDKSKLSLPGLRNEGSTTGRSSCQASDITPGQRFLSAAMAVHASVRLSRLERAKRRAKWAGKKLLVFMLSHIGLILVMLLYATAGGFLFRWLEKDAVVDHDPSLAPVAQERVAAPKMTAADVAPPLDEIDVKLLQIRNRYVQMMWNETVVLNILHQVNWSRSMSVVMKEFEAQVYNTVVEAVLNLSNTNTGNTGVASSLQQTEIEQSEKWTIPASLLFSTTVITSIGYGDITPKTTAGKLVCIPFAILGIPLTLLCLANIGQLMAGCCRFAWRRVSQCGRLCRSKDDHTDKVKGKTRVPISVSLCILLGYTLLGALIFSSWEKGWSFLDGFYFSFITLSTIGFGDLVPGQYEKSSNERRVVCGLYLLVGLAMLSMVFQLMIDSVMEVMEIWAKFFGLSEDQINEEIEGIDDNTNPTPNLVISATHPTTTITTTATTTTTTATKSKGSTNAAHNNFNKTNTKTKIKNKSKKGEPKVTDKSTQKDAVQLA